MKRVHVSVALLVGLPGGWLWGSSGSRHLERALQAAESCNDLLEARTSLLAARVALDDADFREMSRHVAVACGFAGRAGARLERLGRRDEAQRLDLTGIGAEIDAAARLGARLDREAQARAPESTATFEEAAGTAASR